MRRNYHQESIWNEKERDYLTKIGDLEYRVKMLDWQLDCCIERCQGYANDLHEVENKLFESNEMVEALEKSLEREAIYPAAYVKIKRES